MKNCANCNSPIKVRQCVNGKFRNFQRRKYCLTCSPFGSGNTRKINKTKPTRKQNNERFVRWQRKARRERKEKLVKLFGGGCKECGYNKCLAALDFHHVDPTTKKFGLATQGILRNWESVLAEAEKCELLCSNCHAERHDQLL